MGRIPDEELERIKRETDLVALVRARGVELTQHGRDWIGLCPHHDDHEPSLIVSPHSNLWHCLGACNRGGSVIDWVMVTEGVTFRHAVEILRAGVPFAGQVRPSTVPRLPMPVDPEASDAALLLQVVGYYHETLKTSPEAQAYLAARGIGSREAIDRFRLGFANRTLGLRLPSKCRQDGARIRHRLTGLGIIRTSGHEAYNGCVTFPVLDEQGHVVEIYGRKVRDDLRDGTAYHLYRWSGARPPARRGVWNLDALRVSKEIILCEALIDALTFWCAGFANVTSSYGVNGFTADHIEAFKAYGTERVLLAYDRDEAGDRAAEELARKLAVEGITSFRVLFPRGMDANEYALKVTPAAQSLAVLLRSAVYLAGPLVAREGVSPVPPATSPAATVEAIPEPLSSLAAASGAAPEPEAEPAPSPTLTPAVEPSAGPVTPAPRATDNGEQATPPASPIPPPPRSDIPAEVSDSEVVIRLGDRRWRIRGLARATTFEQLRVNVLVARDGPGGQAGPFHVDTLDLYSAKQRAAYVRAAATELGVKEDVVKQDLGQVLLKLEALQEAQIKAALEPKAKTVTIEEPDRQAALELLRDPRLLDRILADFERCGVVGEETNKLVGYLAGITRKLEEPLAIIIQSSSAAGKSALMKAILAFVPEEERVAYSAMTGQSLFYMAEADLKHKILAIAEEEGAERASYALKLLQSEGELSIASTGKDPSTGRLVTHEYRVEGPVMIFLTTTAIDLDEELRNRCLVLTVDEDREQTRAIHRLQRQRRTLEGLVARRERDRILGLHRNAQRLLRPLPVVNPYAPRLTFFDAQTRTRRDHDKYLTLIEAVALLHQHQRPLRRDAGPEAGERIEVTLDDIELANRLAHEALGRTLDELPPQTRRFLLLLDQMVTGISQAQSLPRPEVRFSRWDIRHAVGWSYDQVRVHLDRLVELEYVLVHRGSRGQSFVYELLWDGKGQDGQPFFIGLIDVTALRQAPTVAAGAAATTAGLGGGEATLGGQEPGLGGREPGFGVPLGRHWGPFGAPLGGGDNGRTCSQDQAHPGGEPKSVENAAPGTLPRPVRSYVAEGRSEPALPLAAAAPAAKGGRRQ